MQRDKPREWTRTVFVYERGGQATEDTVRTKARVVSEELVQELDSFAFIVTEEIAMIVVRFRVLRQVDTYNDKDGQGGKRIKNILSVLFEKGTSTVYRPKYAQKAYHTAVKAIKGPRVPIITGGNVGLIRRVTDIDPTLAPTHEGIKRAVQDLIVDGSADMTMARYVQEYEPSGMDVLLDWVGKDCSAYDKAVLSHDRLRVLSRGLLPIVTAQEAIASKADENLRPIECLRELYSAEAGSFVAAVAAVILNGVDGNKKRSVMVVGPPTTGKTALLKFLGRVLQVECAEAQGSLYVNKEAPVLHGIPPLAVCVNEWNWALATAPDAIADTKEFLAGQGTGRRAQIYQSYGTRYAGLPVIACANEMLPGGDAQYEANVRKPIRDRCFVVVQTVTKAEGDLPFSESVFATALNWLIGQPLATQALADLLCAWPTAGDLLGEVVSDKLRGHDQEMGEVKRILDGYAEQEDPDVI